MRRRRPSSRPRRDRADRERSLGPMTAPVAPGLLSVEAAREALLADMVPVATERVATSAALGRVVAAPVIATVSLPPWPNAAMDGYAIQARDTADAADDRPVELRVIGDIAAGAA